MTASAARYVVAKANELRDGEMRLVEAGTEQVLLVRLDGRFHAYGARCPHHQAPLVEGALNGTRLVCPWHHACFDLSTGQRDEPPALDGLRRWSVEVDGDEVAVTVGEAAPPALAAARRAGRRTFVIVGGGAAGQQAAEELRASGFDGRIIMLTAEDALPYDRPHLSKEYLREAGLDEPATGHHRRSDAGHHAGEAEGREPSQEGQADETVDATARAAHGHDLSLRDEAFYADREIEVWRGRRAGRLLAGQRTVTLDDGSDLAYDALLVATGAVPRSLDVPGARLANVFSLRSQADADRIAVAARAGARAVIVGASFIGMEVAASLRERGLDITVVAPGAVPLERVLGARIGGVFQRIHEDRGVAFRMRQKVARLDGRRSVDAVILESGERLEADLVVVGVGVRPATSFIDELSLSEDGGVPVDRGLRAAAGLYAAGDVARYPDPQTGTPVRIEHWRVAQQHGRLAARSMLGRPDGLDLVPFFWTDQYDIRLGYVGVHAGEEDAAVFWGNPEERRFLAFYGEGRGITAVAGLGRDRELAVAEELLRLGRMPDIERLRGDEIDLAALLRSGWSR